MAQAMVRWQPYNVRPLNNGQRIDLGERSFEVIEVPGHTPGCVCLLDSDAKVLFVGDTIVATPAWLYLKHSLPLKVYRDSLLRLRDREKKLLGKIRGAIQRLAEGTLDECEQCGEPIGFKRLMARPVTTLCIHCKEEREEREKLQASDVTEAFIEESLAEE